MRQLQVESLYRSKVAEAFPLIQLAESDFTLPKWCAYASGVLASADKGDIGLLIAVDQHGQIFGVVDFMIGLDGQNDRSISVRTLIVRDVTERCRRAAAELLLLHLDEMAQTQACSTISVQTSRFQEKHEAIWIAPILMAWGYQQRGREYSKHFLARPEC